MKKFFAFFTVSRNVYWLGFVIAVAASLIELLRGGAENYGVFRDATLQFWQGISSYTPEYVGAHGRYFIYSPLFCLLFTPFAFMPFYLGGLLWNMAGYTLFYYAIRTLPGKLKDSAAPMLLYLLLFVGQNVFSFQFNLLVTCIFLLAFNLMERDKPFWAILLIMVSATTKIYGIVELALLLCYPRFWRNIGYAVLCGIGLVLLPAIRLGTELFTWYGDWFFMLSDHHDFTGVYLSLIFAEPIRFFTLPYMRLFQALCLLVLGVLFFMSYRRWSSFDFKVGALAGLMGFIVLFGEAAEFTTYIIAATGYALWFFHRYAKDMSVIPWYDKLLASAIFLFFGVMPIDILFPTPWCMYIHTTLWLGVWTFFIAWCRIIYTTIYTTTSSISTSPSPL